MNTASFRRLLPFVIIAFVVASCQDKPTDPANNTSQGAQVELASIYSAIPNSSLCTVGTLLESERTKVLNYVNAMRARHGLAAVAYRHEDDQSTADAALIMLANNVLNHEPPSSYSCWTQAGRDAAEKSDLAMRQRAGTPTVIGTKVDPSEGFVDQWLMDSTVENAGHRRWILNPWLRYISFGRCDKIEEGASFNTITSSAALRVIYDEMSTPSSDLKYVAYPSGEYPARLWNNNLDLSFTAIDNPSDIWANANVDFSSVIVTITDDGGGSVAALNIRSLNDGVGVPNVLLWRSALEVGRTYHVHIGGVRMSSGTKSFDYTITLSTVV
jgi:uncharacterized protein YkwD